VLRRVVGRPDWRRPVIPLDYCQPVGQALPLSPDHQAAVERFARYLAGMRRSPHTQRLYLGSLRRWLAAGGEPGHVNSALLARWLAIRRQRVATATVNLDIKALRAFYRLQRSWESVADADLQRLPRQRKPPSRTVRWLTDEQVGEVLGACPLDTFIGLRDYAMLLTLYVTGVRASELAGMQLGDVIDREVLFVRGKGGKDRYVPIGEQLAGVLDGYVHARSGTRPGKRSAFWLKADGKPLRNGRSVWEIVSKRIWHALGQRGGLHRVGRGGKPWTGHYPHALRASFATALLHHGMPLTSIAQLMGHSSVDTTAHYLGVDLPYLKAAAARHPRALRVASVEIQPGLSGSATSPARNERNAARESCLQLSTPTAPRRSR
jgi:site-specific recombinase XerD